MLDKAHVWLLKWAKITTIWLGSISSLIVHTILFVGIFSLLAIGVTFDSILLILTTLVSMEAIYLAIFLQMTVNQMQELEDKVDHIDDQLDEMEKKPIKRGKKT